MKRLFSLLSILFVSIPFIVGQTPLPFHPDLIKGEMDNGFTYYILKNEMPRDIVSIRLVTKVGSILEEEHERGVAHFVEHMAFNGTENFPGNSLIEYLETRGVTFGRDLNAFVSFEQTVYMMDVRSDDPQMLDSIFLILEDWTGRLIFDPDEVADEIGVISAEYRGRLGANDRMMNKTFPVEFMGSMYAERLPIGKLEVIESMERETLAEFYRKWYRPELMALVVVGDVDTEFIESEIQRRFAFLSSPEDAPERRKEQLPLETGVAAVVATDAEATSTRARLFYRHEREDINTVENYRTSVLRSLFTNMMRERLSDYTRLADPPFNFAFSSYGPSIGNIDVFSNTVVMAPDKVAEAISVAALENRRAQLHGFTESELNTARASIRTNLERAVLERDQQQSRVHSSSLMSRFLNQSPFLSPEQQQELTLMYLDNISLEDINDAVESWIRPEDWILSVMAPEIEGIDIPGEEELIAMVKEIMASHPEPLEEGEVPENLIEEIPEPAAIVSEGKNEEMDIHFWTFENGATVYFKKTDFRSDEILVRAARPGGSSVLGADDLYNATLATRTVFNSGLGPWSRSQLQRFNADKVMSLNFSIGGTHTDLMGSTSPRNLRAFFETLHLVMEDPQSTDEGFSSNIASYRSFLINQHNDPNNYFFNRMSEIISKNNERRKSMRMEDLEDICKVRGFEIFQSSFDCANDWNFFFVGNADMDVLKEYTARYIGTLSTCEEPSEIVVHPIEFEREDLFHLLYKGQEERAMGSGRFQGDFEYTDRNSKILGIANAVSNILLRERIREELGGVYFIRMFGGANRFTNTFEIGFMYGSEPDKMEMLMDESLLVLTNIRDNGLPAGYLDRVREQQLQTRRLDLQENRYWVQGIRNAVLFEEDFESMSYEELEAFWETVTEDEVQAMLQKVINDESMIGLILYPEYMK
ncbi:MAG: insulinase family protein [Saprospirales bacterium]|nr:MAG: insulinase family protein [Saprospirales bacterium]